MNKKVYFISDTAKIYKDVIIKESNIYDYSSIGDYSIIRYSNISNYVEIGRRNTIDTVDIGKSTYTGEFCTIKHCQIGKYCSISWNVSIGGANHQMERLSTIPLHRVFHEQVFESYKSFEDEKLVIGNDVWIASNVCILRGVSIGDGAIIGAGSVVTKDVPPYAIVCGVPAKIIKYRFNDNIIKELLKISWWDLSDDKLNLIKDFFNKELTEETLCEIKHRLEVYNG